MKKRLFLFCPVLLLSTALLQEHNNDNRSGPTVSNSISCAPGADAFIYTDANGKFIAVLPGWGSYAYRISTKSDSAQVYFNQGLTMYYSYHAREAAASFREAARFDSTSAIAYWGQALAMGPSYNYGYAYTMPATLPLILEKMNSYAAQASPKEKDLIGAMNRRYDPSDAADKNRKNLNAAYAAALQPLVTKYADDIDMKALYTDAVMLLHPWDFWHNNGTAKTWTDELVQHCKAILAQHPQHPGALHYYIHLTEASRQPEVTLPSADSLIKLFPGVAHMVHMSSHEYERIGYYAKGVDANEKADRSLVVYDSLAKGLFPVVHVSHYFAVDAYCALSGGMYAKAIPKALNTRYSVSPTYENTYQQYLYMFPLFAMVRMGKWQDVLQDTTTISADWTYAGLLNDFAKGMAYTKTGNHTQALKHLEQLRQKKEDKILKARFVPYTSSPYECAAVAENILAANIYFNQKNYRAALATIEKAIAAEEALIYSEPSIWMLPARQYLGAFLMQLNKPTEAERVYRADLAWNPGNGWSLLGLYQALQKQGKNEDLKKLEARYTYSFSDADVMPTVSAY